MVAFLKWMEVRTQSLHEPLPLVITNTVTGAGNGLSHLKNLVDKYSDTPPPTKFEAEKTGQNRLIKQKRFETYRQRELSSVYRVGSNCPLIRKPWISKLQNDLR